MSDQPTSEVLRPTDDVSMWIEGDASIHFKAVTRFGDPVELTAAEARAIAQALDRLAAELEATDRA